jgi:hypothetical protein
MPLRAKMRVCGVRALIRKTGLSQHTIEKILRGLPVRRATLQRVIAAIDRWQGPFRSLRFAARFSV